MTLLTAGLSIAVKRHYDSMVHEPAVSASTSLWAPVYNMRIVGDMFHDEDAFTQGLVYAHGNLWESTGLVGASRVRKLSMEEGTDGGNMVAETANMDKEFGEGLAKWDKDGTHLIQLTWRDEKANIWSTKSPSGHPELVSSFMLPGERWGIAMEETTGHFYVSDGSPFVKVYEKDAATIGLKLVRELKVTDGNGVAVHLVNELELIEGQLWANIWMSPLIARINTESGRVESWISADVLQPEAMKYRSPGHQIDVLNGIAYDDSRGKIYVTGKLWPRMFEIQVVEHEVYRENISRLNPFFVNEEQVRQIWRSTGKNV